MIDLRIDASDLVDVARSYGLADKQIPRVLVRALNHTGKKAHTQVKRTLVKETGLKAKDVAEGLSQQKAKTSNLEYAIVGRGRHMSLRAFGARQTKKGVSAKPWNKRRVFKGFFIVEKLGGQVFAKTNEVGWHKTRPRRKPAIEKKWGPSLPRELIRGESHKRLEEIAERDLDARVLHEAERVLEKAGGTQR